MGAGLTLNLAEEMKKQLPPELLDFVLRARDLSSQKGESLYLVGGAVRDLLLGRPNFDVDLVVEGNAPELARQLEKEESCKTLTHHRFGTVCFQPKGYRIDIATARSETYSHPGALPTVKPGTIAQDLVRRDFTINAMAIHLAPDRYGEVLDLYGGKADLDRGLVRILHPRSFIDDATRILRALRYEQRLGFHLESETARSLEENLSYLDTISGDRLRHEIEIILKEERPELVLRRAEELGVLAKLYPGLKGNGWLAEKFLLARSEHTPSNGLYLALLLYTFSAEEVEGFIQRFRPTRATARTLRDSARLKELMPRLSEPDLQPSEIFQLLQGFSADALQAVSIAAPSPIAQKHLLLFRNRLRYVKCSLNGEDLMGLGVSPGPALGEIAEALLKARLDGELKTRKEEEALVRRWLQKG